MPQQTSGSYAADQAAKDAADKAAKASANQQPIDPDTGQPMSPFDPRYTGAKAAQDQETLAHQAQGHNAQGPETPPAAEFGGYEGGADDYRKIALDDATHNDALQKSANDAMNYGLSQMNAQRGPQSVENGVLTGREAAGRAGQQSAIGLMRGAAMGNAPSVAEGQTRQAMNGLMGTQAGNMGAARGLAALNGSQVAGGAAMGNAAGSLAAQGGIGRSNEITQAIGQYGGMAGDIRQQDLNRLGQNSQNSNFNADLNDAYQVGMGQNALGAGRVGNSLELSDQARYGASMQPGEAQFQADQESQGWKQGADTDVNRIANAKGQDKRKSDADLYKGIGGSIVTGAGTAFGGPVGGGVAGAGWNYATG